MTAGIQVAGTDLDTLLAPIGSFTAISNTGFQVAGTDIANRYAGASHGTAYGTTNIQANGTDIGTLFAAAGTVIPHATFSATMTAGVGGGATGYRTGSQTFGSVTTATDSAGNTISNWYTNGSHIILVVSNSAANVTQSYFTTLVSNLGTNFASSAATFTGGGTATCQWSWAFTTEYASTSNYSISFS